MDILTRVKIIDREAEGYCSVGHISAVSPEGLFTVTVEVLSMKASVGRAQLLDVIRGTHGYTPEQCEGILDYAAVIELLLKTSSHPAVFLFARIECHRLKRDSSTSGAVKLGNSVH